MKKKFHLLIFACIFIAASCKSAPGKNKTGSQTKQSAAVSNAEVTGDGIVGSWKEIGFTLDPNRNYQLDESERSNLTKPEIEESLIINADGSCIKSLFTKKGHYQIKTRDDNVKIITITDDQYGTDTRYRIISVSSTELVLYNYGTGWLHLYKRV